MKKKQDWEGSYHALMIIACHQLISMRDQLTDTIDMLVKHAPGFDFQIKKAGEEIKEIEEMLRQSRGKS